MPDFGSSFQKALTLLLESGILTAYCYCIHVLPLFMSSLTKRNGIKLHIELLRLIFIFGIVYVHIWIPNPANAGWKSCAYNIIFHTAKLAVPIFFMITGALLIHKEENWQSFIVKRFFRAISFMLAFFAVQIGFLIYKGFHPAQCDLFVIFTQYIFNSYYLAPTGWFIFTYFSLILLLPIIRFLAKSLPNCLYLYLFFLQFIFCGVVPMVYFLLFHREDIFYSSGCTNTPTPYSTFYGVFYMLLGYFLEYRCQLNKRQTLLFGCTAILTMIAICTLDATSHVRTICLLGFQPILTAFIYIATKRFFIYHHLPTIINRIIIILGGAAFSIMLTENIFREWLLRFFDFSHPGTRSLFCLKIEICFVTCLCGFLVGIITKRIPILNKVI